MTSETTKKDPAFLFYTKDFYEGTRMMLPEERACYVDLLVYQHQHGVIPLDLKRVSMYCSGIDEATLEATLEAKFKQTSKGWVNEKLSKVVSERSEFKNTQSINGTIGQFWKKCKTYLTSKEYIKLRSDLENVDKNILFKYLTNNKIDKTTLKGSLKALLKHLVNVNVNVNEDLEENEISVSEKTKTKIEPQKVIDLFHQFCPDLPQVQVLNKSRKSVINGRLNEYGLNKITEVFRLAGKSNFLNGVNSKNWNATFDWILKPINFAKILEGNFKNKNNGGNTQNFVSNR